MRKSVIIITGILLPITFVCHGQAAQVHPHLLVKPEDKEIVLGKIKSKACAGISVIVPAVKKGEFGFSPDRYPCETEGWAELETAEDVCKAYPERMKSLIGSLDLDNRSLKKVRDAYENNNIIKACEQLLEYYIKGTTASYLRKELPASSPDNDSDADSIVLNIYNFYNQPYKVPKDVSGHLYWQCHGPSDDIEWAWALNRHYHISTLLSSYFRTGNSKYARTIDRDIKDWITCSLPYPGVKSNSEMWRGLEVSFRVKAWSNVFYGLMKSSDLTPATRLLILSSLQEHAHYARNFHAQGNWLTMELSGLATVATSWPEFKESSSWLRYSSESMTKSLGEQVYPDGAQTELTSSYHTVALNNFSLFKDICDRAGYTLPGLFSNQLENMWNYLAYTIKPDGYGLLNNDADLINNRDKITKASEQYKRPDWLFIATNGEKGVKPSGFPTVIFPWAGHFIMRSGFEKDAHYGFFDIGPWGTGHQHNDKLHLSLSAFGRDFLVDGGRFAYRGEVAGTFRSYAVGSLSHNVMIPDGKLQGAGPALAKEPVNPANYSITGIYNFASGSFDRFTGFDGKISHNRSVLYVRGEFWIVLDHISGGHRKKSEFLWHWHPDCEVRIVEEGISAVNGDSEMRLIQARTEKMKIELIKGQLNPYPQGWYSAEYNIAAPSVASVFTGEIDENSNFLWLIVPAKRSSGIATIKILEENEDGMKAAIFYEGKEWEVFIPVYNSTLASVDVISGMSGK